MHYDDLISRLRQATKLPMLQALCDEAADAIQELSQIAAHYEEESNGWWIAAVEAKEKIKELSARLEENDG